MPFWSPDSRDLGFFAGGALETRVGRRGTGSARDRQRRPLDWLRRLVGGRRDDRGQQAGRAVPRAGGRRCDDCPHETSERGLGALLAEFSAGRPPVPVHREAVDPDRGSERTRHLPGVAGQPEDRAASARSLERRVRLARLSRLRPGGDACGGAIRPGGGTRHRPADRDRRSGGDRRPVLLRGHFCVSRRDPGGPTAASSRLPRFERAQCGTAPGRSQRHGQPGSHCAAVQLLHGAEPNRQPHAGHLDPRPTCRHAGPVADGPLERPHRAADDDARIYRRTRSGPPTASDWPTRTSLPAR